MFAGRAKRQLDTDYRGDIFANIVQSAAGGVKNIRCDRLTHALTLNFREKKLVSFTLNVQKNNKNLQHSRAHDALLKRKCGLHQSKP